MIAKDGGSPSKESKLLILIKVTHQYLQRTFTIFLWKISSMVTQ